MKKIITLLLVLVMVLSLCACGGEKASETTNKTSDDTGSIEEIDAESEGETEATEAEQIINNIGDTVSTDIVEATLIDVSFEDTYLVTPKDGYSFVIVDFSMKNIGKNNFGMFIGNGGNKTKLPSSLVAIDYNDGYTFICDDVEEKNGSIADDSCFCHPNNAYVDDLKPFGEGETYKVAICVPNEVVENTEAPLLIKLYLMNSQYESEVAVYSVR